MDISKFANTAGGFRLSNKNATLGINPEGVEQNKCDAVFLSQEVNRVDGQQLTFDLPGEYEINSVMVDGIALGQSTGFGLSMENLRIGYIPQEVEKIDDAQVEAYGELDILITPVLGNSVEATNKLIGQLEPKFVIAYGQSDGQMVQLQAEFGKDVEKLDHIKISSKELQTDQQRLVQLS